MCVLAHVERSEDEDVAFSSALWVPGAELGSADWMISSFSLLAISPASPLSLYKFILYLIYFFYFVPFFFI